MTVRSLPERCWLYPVEHVHDGGRHWDELHSVGGDGSQFFPAIAEVWSRADLFGVVPLPVLADAPCLVLSCSSCCLVFGTEEGEHFSSVAEAVEVAAGQGWVGELCPWCARHAGVGLGDSVDGPGSIR